MSRSEAEYQLERAGWIAESEANAWHERQEPRRHPGTRQERDMSDEKLVRITPQVAMKAKALQASGEGFEVRSRLDLPIVGDDGEEDVIYKDLEECTPEDIQAWVERELQRASEIEDEVAAIVVYTGGLGPLDDTD